jgi:hypothetical protein
MDSNEIEKVVKRAELERSLKSEGLNNTEERVTRFLELGTVEIAPEKGFASVTAECKLLFRDGYFVSCVALCQALAESVVRNYYVKSLKRKPVAFEYNIKKLRAKKKISPECEQALGEVWQGRDDYAYLNPLAPEDKAKLQAMAKEKVLALWKAETEILALSNNSVR